MHRALQETGSSADSVSFVFVDDRTMSDYHGRYVDVPRPTDVLSFPAADLDPGGERDLGDVVICTDHAARQARPANRSYTLELEVLALHGLLHLLGHDHERDSGQMQALELRLRPEIVGYRGKP
ncbi:MAG: rRNA maturation RNase YbeY [Acidobacteria bacterium]|nr:rRNA maturation RNase YbeY [Acidobacteriota bacterium]